MKNNPNFWIFKAGGHRFKFCRIEGPVDFVIGNRGVERCDIFTGGLVNHARNPVDRFVIGRQGAWAIDCHQWFDGWKRIGAGIHKEIVCVPKVGVARRDERIGRCPVAEINIGDKFSLVKPGGGIGIGSARFQEAETIGDFFCRWCWWTKTQKKTETLLL